MALFHAYIIGGEKDAAMTLLESLVSTHDFSVRGNPDFMMRDYVSFDVEDARDVVAWQSYKPLGDRKVAVIRADFMTHNAQNALLKTLEEPVEHTHLFLVVPKPEMLLPTLLSRVQILGVGSESSDSVARDFIAMPVGERVALVGKLAAKGDDDDASAEVRRKAIGFLESLERHYADGVREGSAEAARRAELVLEQKSRIYIPGSSVKGILELVALSL